ncbi:programmed cell death protein 5-like [Centruroides sculpturatus]|uniref:programmed cell death protein 5-like n=1 Tax=Centruroides sculpturatus TaxID=218467 RepID=UPI000C6E758B|nr:programmed cell death protein 5-like [Centruroides sculpturatus]
MADTELEALRAKRLAELQQQYAGNQGSRQNEEEERKIKEEEFRNHVLTQVLTQEARARLSTIGIAKPEKAKMIENMLIQMARLGQIQGKLQESDLIPLLERVSEQTKKKTIVKFDRRRAALDSDED